MAFTLPELPYAYDARGDFMSAETLEYHHDKHHKAYVDNGNKLAEEAGMADKSLEEIVKASHGTNAGLFNNAAQHYNHVHFWHWMAPNGGGTSMPSELEKAINDDLGGYDQFKADFMAAGAMVQRRSSAAMFGSIPITLTTATRVPSTWKPSSTT